ncbi:FRIGIDA-like protein 4a-like [Hibiscus syriacus]|uniref:Protein DETOXIFICATION n=1 Tax=Hibiscus syriacus TaxID=106335 RepID=A0A6A3C0W6_HIBSY|nr:FRIGIDA-like protein 4a-like [Hibiscus syriacus]
MVSMVFLGRLGDVELAAGSLAIAFANITGYSVLFGLALGMEPLCSQAFGARRTKLLSLTLHRYVVFLLFTSVLISVFWMNMFNIFVYLRQDPNITRIGQKYMLFSLPDLFTNSLVHPIRIYLRAQGFTHPLTFATLIATILHLQINLILVSHFNFGVAGVAASASISNFFVLVSLVVYVWYSGIHEPTWEKPSLECFTGWKPLLKLAAPSCLSVCLEWWWYEIMIVLCGILANPKATVASMGILIQTTSLIYVFPSSLSFAVSTRVGNALGENRPYTARLSAVVAVFLSAMMGISASTFASAMRAMWAMMFTSDSEILRLTSIALPILGLCELGNCPQTVGCGVLRGSARPSTAANVNLGAFYLVGMPVAVGLGFYLRGTIDAKYGSDQSSLVPRPLNPWKSSWMWKKHCLPLTKDVKRVGRFVILVTANIRADVDHLSWIGSPNGRYCPRLYCRDASIFKNDKDSLWSLVWANLAPPKVEAFVSKLLQHRIPSSVELAKRGGVKFGVGSMNVALFKSKILKGDQIFEVLNPIEVCRSGVVGMVARVVLLLCRGWMVVGLQHGQHENGFDIAWHSSDFGLCPCSMSNYLAVEASGVVSVKFLYGCVV